MASEWDELFGAVKQSALPRTDLDHSPIILEYGHWARNVSYFKFKNMWLEHPNFEELVRNWWMLFNILGSPDYIFAKKLELLKLQLKEWNKSTLVFWRIAKLLY